MNLYFKSEKIYGIWCEICWAGQGQSQGKKLTGGPGGPEFPRGPGAPGGPCGKKRS